MTSLTNPVVLAHPYYPDVDPEKQINPARHQVIDLEIPHSVFNPSAKSWGAFRRADNVNLARTYSHLIENFLALAHIALSLSKRPDPQIHEVRLLYYSVLDPSTYVNMMENGQTPKTKLLKTYHSHVLRLVTTKPPQDAYLPQTFANMQKVINTQKERLAAEAEKNKGPRKKRKRRRSDSDDDGGDDDDQERKEREEADRLIKDRERRYGVSNPKELPKFVNDSSFKRSFERRGDKLIWVPDANATKWVKLVDDMLGRTAVVEDNDINRPDHPYNPSIVFSPQLTFEYRFHQLEGDEVYKEYQKKFHLRGEDKLQDEIHSKKWYLWKKNKPMTFNNGMEMHIGNMIAYGTPYEGETCWLLSIVDFRPDTFREMFFPWAIDHISKDNNDEVREYVHRTPLKSHFRPSMLLGEEKRMVDRMMAATVDDVETHFRHQVNLNPVVTTGFTKEKWKKDCAENRKRDQDTLDQEFKDSDMSDPLVLKRRVARQRELRLKTQLNNFEQFMKHIFTSESTNSRAGRAIVKWYRDKERQAKAEGKPLNFSFPRQYKHHNMSSFGDLMANEIEELTELCFVQDGQENILRMLLASLQIPIRDTMPMSTLQWSTDGGPGKSNSLKVAQKHHIPDTHMSVTNLTGKAFTSSDQPKDEDGWINYFDGMMMYQDELQPSMVGSSAPGSQEDDKPAMFKSMMTCGEFINVSPITNAKDAENGHRDLSHIKARCRTAYQMATNKHPSEFSAPFLTRPLVVKYPHVDKQTHVLTGGVIGKMDGEMHQSEISKLRMEMRFERWRRNQFFAFILGNLIESGDFCHINTRCVRAVWQWLSEVQDQERFSLSGLEQGRNYEQTMGCSHAVVLLDLFDKLFDIPGAPLGPNRAWKWKYLFIYFERHLIALTEHATFAFGMMRSRFENLEYMQSRDLLYKWLKETSVAYKRSHRQRPAQITEDSATTRSSQGNQPRDVVEFYRNAVSEGSFCVEWRVRNPSIFLETSSRSSQGEFSSGYRPQVIQLANKLSNFNCCKAFYPKLSRSAILQSVAMMMELQVNIPVWDHQFKSVDGMYQVGRQLVIETGWGQESVIKVPVIMRWEKIDDKQKQTTDTSMRDALEYVLQTEHLVGCRRDLVYGARHLAISDVWQTLSLCSRDQLTDEQLANIKKSHNAPLYDDDGKARIEGVEIVGSIDKHFLDDFYIEHNVGKVIRWLYPSNDPVHLMRMLYLMSYPYEMRPPYPMHHESYFPGALQRRKDLAIQQNGLKRKQLMLEGTKPPDQADQDIDSRILERTRQLVEYKSLLKHPLRRHAVERGGRGWDIWKSRIRSWVNLPRRKPVDDDMMNWVTSDTIDLAKLPKDAVDPLAQCLLEYSTCKAEYDEMISTHNDTIVTIKDCHVDPIQDRIQVNQTWWIPHNGHLQLYNENKNHSQSRLMIEQINDDDDEADEQALLLLEEAERKHQGMDNDTVS
jgi:hypothetical protein